MSNLERVGSFPPEVEASQWLSVRRLAIDFRRSCPSRVGRGLLLRSWTIPSSRSARITLPLSSSSKRTMSPTPSLWLMKRLQIVTARLVLGSRAEEFFGKAK